LVFFLFFFELTIQFGAAEMADFTVESIPTTPYANQKPGTSGLRKKVSEVMQKHYLANFVQAIFDALPKDVKGMIVSLNISL